MNREIKFRAWDAIEKEMVYGLTEMLKRWDENIDDLLCMDLMEYTGLKDKNEEEIYEDDIIKESNSIGIIVYNEDGFEIKWHNDNDFYNSVLKIHHLHLEIIGNVYENQELLKGE